MIKHLSALIGCTATVVAMMVSGGAAAQSTWNLGSSACGSGASTYTTLTCTGSSTSETATMTAWGTATTGGNFAAGTLGNFDPSGFGAYVGTDAGSPQHAFDSSNPTATTELMLISFGPVKVSLTSMAIGWWQGDADVSILRWDGAGAPPVLTGMGTSGLAGAGWSLIATQDLLNNGTTINNPNGGTANALSSSVSFGNQVSSYWMISTYYGGTGTASLGILSTGNDAFKILSFTANVCTSGIYTGGNGGNGGTCGGTSVPEPGSLALAAVAIFGLGAARRRVIR